MSTATPTIELRSCTEADTAFVSELVREVKGAELMAGGVIGPMLEQLIDLQRKAQETHAATAFPHLESSIIAVDGEAAGRLQVAFEDGRLHLVDIALLRRYRGRGIGTRLITELLDGAGHDGLEVTLRVHKISPARRLFERLGFTDPVECELHWELTWTPPAPDEGETS